MGGFKGAPIRANSKGFSRPVNQSPGILDDHGVRKNIATQEGTIERTPTNDNHIANKKYVDDNIGGGTVTATVSNNSTGWMNCTTTVSNNSAAWASSSGCDSVISTVSNNSTGWQNATTTLDNNSTGWQNVESTVSNNSTGWENTETTVSNNSVGWENAETTLSNNSTGWENVESTVSNNSTGWENVITTVNNNSSNFHTQNTDSTLASGAVSLDANNASTAVITNIAYGTGDPPTASTTTIGSLYVTYTA